MEESRDARYLAGMSDPIPHPEETAEQRAARRRLNAPGNLAGIDEATIHRVVHAFYERIRADAILGPIFEGAIAGPAWPHHLSKMVDFWSSVLLATGRYDGRPMPAHIRLSTGEGAPLDATHFARWLGLFRQTLSETVTPDAAVLFADRAEKIAESFQMGIRFHRGEMPEWLGPAKSAGPK